MKTEPQAGKHSGVIRCYLDHEESPCLQKGLKVFIDGLDDFVIVFDFTGRILYTNPSVCRCLGYARDESASMNVETLFPGLLSWTWEKQFLEVADAVTFVENRPLMSKSGRAITVESKFSKGKWLGLNACISVSRDITVRGDVEKALWESERRLSTLMSNLPGMAYRCMNNRNWTMEFVSEGCYELTGYKPLEFINDRVVSWNDLMHPDDRQWVYDEVQNALAKKQFFRIIFCLTTKAGEKKWVWEQGVGVYSKSGEILAIEGFITDITEHQEAKRQLHSENILLRSSMKESYKFCGIVGRSKAMQEVFDLIMRTAESSVNAIIYGESGTGKELVARAIHELSDRRDKRFVPVNCGAIPENLAESEFFGYKKGAFTGAHSDRPGFLDLAADGTLFLDEVGEINLNLQVKLLRAIEGSGFSPVGGGEVKKPKFRVIAATNKDPKDLIAKGVMREDFFYRIHIIPLTLPPLRERKEDIPLLVYHFLKMFSDIDINVIPQNIMDSIQKYNWPGNIRELQNVIHRYVTLKKIDFMDIDSEETGDAQRTSGSIDIERVEESSLQSVVEDFEKKIILGVLDRHRWHRGDVASILDINYRTLQRKIKKYGIDRHKL